MTLEEAVWRDPERMSGALCFRNDRVPVKTLFDYVAAGELEEFFADYPDIEPEKVEAVLLGAYRLVDEHFSLAQAA